RRGSRMPLRRRAAPVSQESCPCHFRSGAPVGPSALIKYGRARSESNSIFGMRARRWHGGCGRWAPSVHEEPCQEEPLMNAIDLLEADHRKVKKMLAEGEETTERGKVTRPELYATLRR